MMNVQDIYELSPMQQGMLFHTLYAPESGVYFEQRSCLLEGDLHVAAFKQAWQEVVQRHAVLRTAFYWEEADKPLQVVYASAELPWVQEDWQVLTEPEQAEKLEAFFAARSHPGLSPRPGSSDALCPLPTRPPAASLRLEPPSPADGWLVQCPAD